MENQYSIGRLASEAEVPTSTVRYYERIGLLAPSGRTGANYRYYGHGALERLRFIRAAQATGFSLDDIATLLELHEGTREPCGEVQRLIEDRLGDVEQRLADLKRVRRVLKTSLNTCREAADPEHCKVLENLEEAAEVRALP